MMVMGRRLCPAFTFTAGRGRYVGPNRSKQTIHSRNGSAFRRWKTDAGEGSNRSGNPKFSWNQVFLQWALGVYVSTPLIAILQGSFLLNDYRVNYSDAPRPLMPARGVAIAVKDPESKSASKKSLSSWILHPFSASSHHPRGHERSLRLLVVGDSLAAGVGMSKSGVPILPESIARALSKELDGKAVYWTCVGTPGVSAAQIVKDIEQIEPYDPHPKGRQLERVVKEFQNRRRRWLERHKHEDNRESSTPKTDEEKNEKESVNIVVQWWRNIRQRDTLNTDDILHSIQNTYTRRTQLVKEDISAIKEIVLKPLPRLDDDDDDYYYDYYRQNLLADDKRSFEDVKDDHTRESDQDKDKRLPLIHKGSLFRRPSINPEAAAEYDIAVVLTGLNDVKEAFMPHMNSSDTPDAKRLLSSLRQVLEALQHKMGGNMDLEGNREGKNRNHMASDISDCLDSADASSKNESREQPKNLRHPLVVVPELPVAPLQIFRLVPLCWFLVPIFHAMENNKRFLASCFPDNVVFVHQPDLCWWTDDEMGIGSIRENIKQERLLLRVTDTVRSGREQIEQLMKKYYDSKEEELASQNNNSNQNPFLQNSSSGEKNNFGVNQKGSELVSVDRMHPNDEGYELWGRHIAAAIIEHWNKNADSCSEHDGET